MCHVGTHGSSSRLKVVPMNGLPAESAALSLAEVWALENRHGVYYTVAVSVGEDATAGRDGG